MSIADQVSHLLRAATQIPSQQDRHACTIYTIMAVEEYEALLLGEALDSHGIRMYHAYVSVLHKMYNQHPQPTLVALGYIRGDFDVHDNLRRFRK